jgi:hypothetical protein
MFAHTNFLKAPSSVCFVGSGYLVTVDGVRRRSAVGVGFHDERMKNVGQYSKLSAGKQVRMLPTIATLAKKLITIFSAPFQYPGFSISSSFCVVLNLMHVSLWCRRSAKTCVS